jgi:hypothetical protein
MATKDEMFPSKYLKAADLKDQAAVLTVDYAAVETLKNKGVEQRKVVLHFTKTAKQLPLNATNFDSMVDVTGEGDSERWKGAKVEVYPTTTQMAGETIPCIRIRAPAQKQLKLKKSAPAPKGEDADIPFNDEIPSFK